MGDIIVRWTFVVCFHHDGNADGDDDEADKQTKDLTDGNLKLENGENESRKIQRLKDKKETEGAGTCKWWKLKRLVNK